MQRLCDSFPKSSKSFFNFQYLPATCRKSPGSSPRLSLPSTPLPPPLPPHLTRLLTRAEVIPRARHRTSHCTGALPASSVLHLLPPHTYATLTTLRHQGFPETLPSCVRGPCSVPSLHTHSRTRPLPHWVPNDSFWVSCLLRLYVPPEGRYVFTRSEVPQG